MMEKELLRGIAAPIVLRLVAERAMYGYEIIKAVNEKTAGEFAWKEGTLYPLLHRLEGAELIVSDWRDSDEGRPRKYYAITRKGKAELSANLAEWQQLSQAVNQLLLPLSVKLGI